MVYNIIYSIIYSVINPRGAQRPEAPNPTPTAYVLCVCIRI